MVPMSYGNQHVIVVMEQNIDTHVNKYFLAHVVASCNSYIPPVSVSPSKESAVVKQKLSQEEEAKFKVTIFPKYCRFRLFT